MSLEALNRILAKEDKENNQSLLYLLQTLGEKRLFTAEEFNDIRDALDYLENKSSEGQNPITQIPDLTGTGEIGQIYQLPDGSLYTWSGSEFVIVGGGVIQASSTNTVTGTFNINMNVATQEVVMTGATVFSVTNPPPINEYRTITMYLSGNHAVTLPAVFSATWAINGTISGTNVNLIVIEAFNNGTNTKYKATIENLTNA